MPQPMVWIDLEMTGLDPGKEGILEIASIVTDSDLKVLAEGPRLAIHQAAKLLKAMGPWNRTQHRASGLLEEVRQSKISVKKAEKMTLDFLKKFCKRGKSPLCGNAVHHDRRFIVKYMPKLHRFLHYRHVDVSSIKDLIQRWYPRDRNQPKKSASHRALADIRESIEELRYYRENYFKRP